MTAIEALPELAGRRNIRAAEAASILGIGKTKVYELLATGRLTRVRIDGCVRITFDSLDRFLDEIRAEAEPIPA